VHTLFEFIFVVFLGIALLICMILYVLPCTVELFPSCFAAGVTN